MDQQIDAQQLDMALAAHAETLLSRESVVAILADYGNYIGVGELDLDQDNSVSLTIDGEVEVTLSYLPQLPGLVASAELAPELHERPDLMVRLLQANLSWELTQGGCFASIPPGRELVLCRLIPLLDSDPERLDQELGGFVDLVELWQEDLEAALLQGFEADPGDSPLPPGVLRA